MTFKTQRLFALLALAMLLILPHAAHAATLLKQNFETTNPWSAMAGYFTTGHDYDGWHHRRLRHEHSGNLNAWTILATNPGSVGSAFTATCGSVSFGDPPWFWDGAVYPWCAPLKFQTSDARFNFPKNIP